MAGTWTVERARHAATLIVAPFARLAAPARAAVEAEANAMLDFVEPDATRRVVRI